MPQLVDDLAKVPLFSGLTKRQLKKLAGACTERSYGPGSAILREGTKGGIGFFVVADGRATIRISGSEVATLGPGDYFGELALITKRARAATVIAETPLRCLMIRFWDFREFAKDNPDVCWTLLQHLANVLADERAQHAPPALQSG
jgi:CRP-like cAMP-binding protein